MCALEVIYIFSQKLQHLLGHYNRCTMTSFDRACFHLKILFLCCHQH